MATPAGWCWGMAPPDWDWEGKPGRRVGGEEVVTCGLKVTLRGGLGDGRAGMDCGWEGVMEEELEWVGKRGVVSEEDMMAEEVKMEVYALRREGMQAWLKVCPNVRIQFLSRMLYLSNSHVPGYTTGAVGSNVVGGDTEQLNARALRCCDAVQYLLRSR